MITMKNKIKYTKVKTPELLAPAGNLEKLKVAIRYGADAIYAGIPEYSLRVRINNFTKDSLKEAAIYCKKNNKRLYVTLNIFAHNKHYDGMSDYIKYLKKIGVDALIVSDPGIINEIKRVWRNAEIHLSTQANCTNWQSAKFWKNAGVKRIILGREVTLGEIKEIHRRVPEVELEYFIHGAMCMSYSGRCFLSKSVAGRSANLGDCIQPCRWELISTKPINNVGKETFELVEEEHGSYILNSKDLCLIKYIDELIGAGVCSLKIEGRAKSVYYIATVVGAYRKAIDVTVSRKSKEHKRKTANSLFRELNTKLVHRGYTSGFLLGGKAGQQIGSSHLKCGWEFCGEVTDVKRIMGKSVKYKVFIRAHNAIRLGDVIEILTPQYDIMKIKIQKIFNETKGEYVNSAHGGQDTVVSIITGKKIIKNSVIRRKLN